MTLSEDEEEKKDVINHNLLPVNPTSALLKRHNKLVPQASMINPYSLSATLPR